ncbi:hypothetical protein D3C79_1099380 [compost metagenome]
MLKVFNYIILVGLIAGGFIVEALAFTTASGPYFNNFCMFFGLILWGGAVIWGIKKIDEQ